MQTNKDYTFHLKDFLVKIYKNQLYIFFYVTRMRSHTQLYPIQILFIIMLDLKFLR